MQVVDTPLVSIIIPVYNGSDYLEKAIKSALSQSYPNIEVIVVNDGSTDDGKTEQVAKKYDNRVRYYTKPNGGVASALNFGIGVMKGEYFSWLSHDDEYFPDKIDKQIAYIKANKKNNAIIFGDVVLIDENSETLIKIVNPKQALKNGLSAVLYQALNGCTLLIPRYFLLEDNFREDLKTSQDYELFYRLAKKYEFCHVSEIIVKSRFHANQGSRLIASHQQEANSTLIDFLRNLNKDEILSINSPVEVFYLKIAAFYKTWNYIQAAQFAYGLFKENSAKANFSILLLPYLLKYYTAPLPQLLSYTVNSVFFSGNISGFFKLFFGTVKKRFGRSITTPI